MLFVQLYVSVAAPVTETELTAPVGVIQLLAETVGVETSTGKVLTVTVLTAKPTFGQPCKLVPDTEYEVVVEGLTVVVPLE